jgi:hypothetical protein
MSFFSPFGIFNPYKIDDSKILIIDSDSKLTFPSIISTPYTSPVFAFTTQTNNPNLKSLYTYPLSPYLDLNKDPDVHDTVTKSIYKHVFDSWVYKSEFEELFDYITIVGGEPKLITSLKNKDSHNSSESKERKIRFMREYILSKHRVKKLIEDFVEGTKTNWYDIEKNTFFLKELIFKYMKKKLKALVEKKEH